METDDRKTKTVWINTYNNNYVNTVRAAGILWMLEIVIF